MVIDSINETIWWTGSVSSVYPSIYIFAHNNFKFCDLTTIFWKLNIYFLCLLPFQSHENPHNLWKLPEKAITQTPTVPRSWPKTPSTPSKLVRKCLSLWENENRTFGAPSRRSKRKDIHRWKTYITIQISELGAIWEVPASSLDLSSVQKSKLKSGRSGRKVFLCMLNGS